MHQNSQKSTWLEHVASQCLEVQVSLQGCTPDSTPYLHKYSFGVFLHAVGSLPLRNCSSLFKCLHVILFKVSQYAGHATYHTVLDQCFFLFNIFRSLTISLTNRACNIEWQMYRPVQTARVVGLDLGVAPMNVVIPMALIVFTLVRFYHLAYCQLQSSFADSWTLAPRSHSSKAHWLTKISRQL